MPLKSRSRAPSPGTESLPPEPSTDTPENGHVDADGDTLSLAVPTSVSSENWRAQWARWNSNPFVSALIYGGEAWAVRLGIGLFVALVATHAFGPPSPSALGVARGTTEIPDSLLHWDAIQYLWVAQHGYTATQYTAYFPLYPILTNGVHTVTGVSYAHAALGIAWLMTAALAVSLAYLTRTVLGLERWYWPVQLLLWAPASVFFLAGYPEGTEALLFTALMILLARNRLVAAAVVAALASASAPVGVFYGVAVLIRLAQLQAGEVKGAVLAVRAAALGVISELGVIAFSLYLWAEVGHPFAYVSAEKLWNRVLTWPFHAMWGSIHRITHGRSIQSWTTIITYLVDDVATIAAVVLAVALVVGLVRERNWRGPLIGPAGAAVAALIFNVSDGSSGGGSPEALARHLLILVPLYLAASRTRRVERLAYTLAASAVVCTAGAAIFSYGGWFT